MSDLIEFSLDDRWHFLRGMAGNRRAAICRSTTDPETRQQAFADEDAARARIAALERETLAREAAGDWHAEWDDLVAAVFGSEASEPDGSGRSVGSEAPEPSA